MDSYINFMWTVFKIAGFICLAFFLLGICAFVIRRLRGEKVELGLLRSIYDRLPRFIRRSRFLKKFEKESPEFDDFDERFFDD